MLAQELPNGRPVLKLPLPILIANLATLILTLAMNVLANALPLNGRTTGEISDQFPSLFTPAGYVFSIWGLIYLGLVLFAGYQLTPSGRQSEPARRIGWWFAISGLANSVWIVLWHFGVFAGTVVAMLALLVSLSMIARRIRQSSQVTRADRLFVYLPFSVYLGWISVATIANVAILLLSLGWDGSPLSPVVWTVIMLAVATGLGLWMLARRRDWAFAAVLVWAFVGIAVKQGEAPAVPQAALIAAGLLVPVVLWRLAGAVRRMSPASAPAG
jgi:hypothetical protein